MSTPSNDPNPYAAPTTSPEILYGGSAQYPPETTKLIRDFRSQSLALGAAWVFFALIVAAVIVWILNDSRMMSEEGVGAVMVLVLAVVGVCWLTAGITTLMKQLWGVYMGLVLSYLSLLGNLVNINLCGLAITIAIVVQAHRVIGFARKMQMQGIPLNAQA